MKMKRGKVIQRVDKVRATHVTRAALVNAIDWSIVYFCQFQRMASVQYARRQLSPRHHYILKVPVHNHLHGREK